MCENAEKPGYIDSNERELALKVASLKDEDLDMLQALVNALYKESHLTGTLDHEKLRKALIKALSALSNDNVSDNIIELLTVKFIGMIERN